jgi:hypothetical protein
VNGAELAASLMHKDNDLSEFRVLLPPASTAWKQMDVVLSSSEPLRFGYAEVR